VSRILRWFSRHARKSLPWRKTSDPYRIWVSEIMLQQTQVDRVIPKYESFLLQFPDVQALARASSADVIRAWAGLGYNRRALYLWRGAQVVVERYGGIVPSTIAELRTLPGVGPYTSNAIASFAYHQPVTLIDTNHRRVIQRVFFGQPSRTSSAGKRAMEKRVAQQLERISVAFESHRDGHYRFNQALMDVGALVCVASAPKCAACPLRSLCKARPQFESGTRVKRNVTKSSQGIFAGSNRWYRGKIMTILRAEGSIDVVDVKKRLMLDTERLHAIIESLVRDGLLQCKASRLTL
jgi:A/G-specific adenine glycosylase